jgi:hypothetical protein
MLTTITLNNNSEGLNTLRIETGKYNGIIQTTASICRTSYDRGFHTLEFQMFKDFLKLVIATKGMATKKNIAEQHQKALNQLAIIMVEAIAHYQQKNMTLDIDCDVFSTTNNYVR